MSENSCHFVNLLSLASNYRLDGQVCLEVGVVDPLFINFGVVNLLFIHKMVVNTRFKTNLTVHAVVL
jgi:hypothetical protein